MESISSPNYTQLFCFPIDILQRTFKNKKQNQNKNVFGGYRMISKILEE
jgi:hypothetical protein